MPQTQTPEIGDEQVARFDRGLPIKAVVTDEGFIRDVPIVTRVGVFTYHLPDGTVRKELRHPSEVFKADSLSTMAMIPITNNHPSEGRGLVTADNAKRLSIGYTGEGVKQDGEYVRVPVSINDKTGIKAVLDGRQELSLGYICTLIPKEGSWKGERYDHVQTDIRYNHLAIVDNARAGSAARINLDANDGEEAMPDEKLVQVKLDSGIQYPAAPEVVNELDRLRSDNERLRADAATAKDTLSTVTAARDEAKEKLDEALKVDHSDEVNKRVAQRVRVLGVANAAGLDKEIVAKLDEMDDISIMSAVVKAKSPKANLDGADEVYIRARFDSVAETIDEEAMSTQRQKIHGDGKNTKHDGGDIVATARQNYVDSLNGIEKKDK